MKTGAELISEERLRQIEKEHWTNEHDDEHGDFELSTAGACYALRFKAHKVIPLDAHVKLTVFEVIDKLWPWDSKRWKPTPNDPIKQLIKAGALIAAEIDRLQRKKLENYPQ